MHGKCLSTLAARLVLLLVVVLGLSGIGTAQQAASGDDNQNLESNQYQDSYMSSQETYQGCRQKSEATRAGECMQPSAEGPTACVAETPTVKINDLVKNPCAYMGKTVTVDGEWEHTFGDKAFSMEEGKEILVISLVPSCQVMTPLQGKLEEDSDVRVTGVVEEFDLPRLEAKYGPINLGKYEKKVEQGPVLIIGQKEYAALQAEKEQQELQVSELVIIERPTVPEAAPPAPEAQAEPAPEEPAVEEHAAEELPRTAGNLPLTALGGIIAMCAGLGSYLRRRK